MLTGNFNALISPSMRTNASSNLTTVLKGVDGNEMSFNSSNIPSAVISANHNQRLVLGSGATEPAHTDYCAESPINTLTEISSGTDVKTTGTLSYSDYDKFHYLTVTCVVRNDTNAPIVVNEVCIYTQTSSSIGNTDIMLSRNVISPVTIGVGEQKAFSVTIGDE